MIAAKLSILFSSLSTIPGIGSKRSDDYKRLNCYNIRDLIFHFPINLVDRSKSPSLKNVSNGQIITQKVKVESHLPPSSFKGKRPYKVSCSNESGKIDLIYFNAYKSYLSTSMPVGAEIIISGKVEFLHGNLQMVHPDFAVPANQPYKIPPIESVYPLTYKLTNRMLGSVIKHILNMIPDLPEWYPVNLMKERGWLSWKNSVLEIHDLKDSGSLLPTSLPRERLAFDELIAQQLSVMLARSEVKKSKKTPLDFSGDLKQRLLSNLPFKLTDAQNEVIEEIEQDQKSELRMMRLLQGDVGCGKTIVALCAALNAVECGNQAAVLVPTEILANQHFSKMSELCNSLGVQTEIILGNQKAKKRREVLENIKSGKAQIVIGTHAIFQQAVEFQSLSLIIIDEQHRFGVDQRLALANKSKNADFLMMTATPIPRTLCMVGYGDLDISIIKQKPECRIPIQTSMMSLAQLDTLTDRIKTLAEQGEKVYWICPLIEESEALDLANITSRLEYLKKRLGDNVGVVHGKMKPAERELKMNEFIEGKFKVLLATTVIEVGVDVPDANIIVIENSERFGLSQLHQLRGRVGRGDKKSFCILMYNNNIGKSSWERLKVIRDTTDGFEIAEADLKIRGSGQVLGTRQSGLPEFKTCDFEMQSYLLKDANELAKNIFNDDPKLIKPENQNYKLLLHIYDFDKCLKYIKFN